ncbi:MAG: hypothetical protein H7Z72_14565, partial [Bacteroidetes bacterium]|nr:hypothetical protein [Fibrella sp.]
IAILPISYRQGMSLRLRFLPLPHETQLHLIWRRGDQNPVLRNFLTICHDAVATGNYNQLANPA